MIRKLLRKLIQWVLYEEPYTRVIGPRDGKK